MNNKVDIDNLYDIDITVEEKDYDSGICLEKRDGKFIDYDFTIIEDYGSLSNHINPIYFRKVLWRKFTNQSCYDIRYWDNNKPQKGVTLNYNDLKVLYLVLSDLNINNVSDAPLISVHNKTMSILIYAHLAILSTYEKDNSTWNKEINLLSWKGGKRKIDIRHWQSGYTNCGKGVSLSLNEADILKTKLETILNNNKYLR